MSEKRVTAYINGQSAGEEFILPQSLDALNNEIYLRLNVVPQRIFLEDGTEIHDISVIKHSDKLYVSRGEDFLKPEDKKSEWITLNVGGKYFTTSRSTLTSKEPVSMLARIFLKSEDNPLFVQSNIDANGAYLIDRSPTYFEPILNYLRSGHLIFDKSVNPEGILHEAQFFGIDSIIPQLENFREQSNKILSKQKFEKPKNKKSEWITLNVGGKYFTTSRSTLTSKEPTSMLARMFVENEENYLFIPSNVDANGAYLIDRSPTYFEPILNYLRSGHLIFDKSVNPEGILQEAKFFGIDSIIPQLENFREQGYDIPLTRRDVIDALIKSPYTAELRFQGVNLAGADLSKLDLRYINFKYANLQKCKLTGTNLSWCCLERADLSYTNIDGAQLLGVKGLCANLEGASMKNCNFKDPNGTKANMEGVNLKFANLEGSDMCGVNLRVATLKNANLQNCDLRAAVLAGADLEKCDLSGSDLHEANLRGANLKDAAFELMLTPLHMAQAIR